MHCNKTLDDCVFIKIMGRDAIYIPVTYTKVFIWLGFRSRGFLDIPTQQNQIDTYFSQKISVIDFWEVPKKTPATASFQEHSRKLIADLQQRF